MDRPERSGSSSCYCWDSVRWGTAHTVTPLNRRHWSRRRPSTRPSCRRRTVNQRRGTPYITKATFEYSYQGESHTSSNVYPGPLSKDFGSKADPRAQLDGYGTGDTVTAYVPPDSPGNAFLNHESSNKPLFVIGLGGSLAGGTLLSVFRR